MDNLIVPEPIPALPSPECICKTHRIILSGQNSSDNKEQEKEEDPK